MGEKKNDIISCKCCAILFDKERVSLFNSESRDKEGFLWVCPLCKTKNYNHIENIRGE